MASLDHQLKALEFFKDWSNYMLVTTVAALGWVGSGHPKSVSQLRPWVRTAIVSLSLSAVLAIFTLAAVPIIAEHLKDPGSIYDTVGRFSLFPGWVKPEVCIKLKWVCWPQHVMFIIGIIAFAVAAYRAKTWER